MKLKFTEFDLSKIKKKKKSMAAHIHSIHAVCQILTCIISFNAQTTPGKIGPIITPFHRWAYLVLGKLSDLPKTKRNLRRPHHIHTHTHTHTFCPVLRLLTAPTKQLKDLKTIRDQNSKPEPCQPGTYQHGRVTQASTGFWSPAEATGSDANSSELLTSCSLLTVILVTLIKGKKVIFLSPLPIPPYLSSLSPSMSLVSWVQE